MAPASTAPAAAESPRLIAALLLLTFSTGIIDAISVLGLGKVFTANMTGNVVFLGFAAAGAPDFDVARSGVALLAFLVGALAGGSLSAYWAPDQRHRWLAIALVIEAAALAGAAVAAWGYTPALLQPTARLFVMLTACAFAMGLRNATMRRLGLADLTTTVLTLTLTGIGADARLAGGSSPRLLRRIGAVVLMAAGGGVGVLLLRSGSLTPAFFVSIAAALAAALLAVRRDH